MRSMLGAAVPGWKSASIHNYASCAMNYKLWFDDQAIQYDLVLQILVCRSGG